MPLPVFVEFIAGTGGLAAGIAEATALMGGMKASSELSLASVGKVGVALSGAVAVGAGLVAVASVKMAGDFQQNVVKLETTAGELHSNLQLVGDGMLTMAGQVGIGANELATGMYTVESAGFHGADALNVLKASAQGAKQENADLSNVTDAVSTALRDYHLPASEAADVTSQLITAVSHGKTTFDELTGALHSVTPIASAANVSLADATGTLSAMTASGMSAEQAAQNLGATIGRLSAPTQPMIKELGALGINANELSKNLGSTGVAGTMQEVSQAILQHMGPAGTTLLATFNQSTQAGYDADKMFKALPPDAQKLAQAVKDGSESFADYRKSAGGLSVTSKALTDQWLTNYKSAEGFSSALKSGKSDAQTYISAMKQATGGQEALSVALQSSGENAVSTNAAIKDIAGSASQADGSIKGWSEVQGNFNQQLAELHATVGALAIRFGTVLLPAVTKIAEGMRVFFDFVANHQWALAGLAAVIGGALIVALSALSVALWTIAANPVVIVIAGIVAALILLGIEVYEIWTHWSSVWGWIKDLTGDVAHFFSSVWDTTFAYVKGKLEAVAGFFSSRWNEAYATVRGALNIVVTYITEKWNLAYAVLSAGVTTVVHWITSRWDELWQGTQKVWNAISGWFAKWWPLLLVIFFPFIALIVALWNHFHQQVWDTLVRVWDAVSGFLEAVWGHVTDAARIAWAYVVSAWDAVEVYLAGKWATVTAAAQAAWTLFSAYVIDPITNLWNRIVAVWDGVMTYLGGVWNSITAATRAAWSAIYNAVAGFLSSMLNSVSSTGGSVLHAITQPFLDAWNYLSGLVGDYTNIGHYLIMGVVHGVENAGGALLGAIRNVASSALRGAMNFLGINSPSLLFSQSIGSPIAEGIAHGITGSGHMVDTALNTVTRPRDFNVGTVTAGASTGIAAGQNAGGADGGLHIHFDGPVYGGPSGVAELAQIVRTELLKVKARNGTVGLA